MSKSLTYAELEKQGLKLSQGEAQSLHTRISDIAKGIHESGEVFELAQHDKMGQANNVKTSNGFTPLSGDDTLKQKPTEQKVLKLGDFNKKDNTLKADGYKIGDLYPRIEVKPEPELVDFIITDEYLTDHPEVAESGAKVGDTIKVPAIEGQE
jgi:hypothetical protein